VDWKKTADFFADAAESDVLDGPHSNGRVSANGSTHSDADISSRT
jgi:hypothetical protein